MDNEALRRIAKELANSLPSDAKAAWCHENKLLKYKDDPVGFCEKELGERFPKKIQELMLSVLENPITIAKSSNAFGKSFSAASIAVWFYKCHEEVQVYSACAPPEANLRRILWGQIGNKVRKNPNLFKDDLLTVLRLAPKAEVSSGGEPINLIAGLTIPQSGSEMERESRFNGKHSPNLLFLVDEADGCPDEIFTAFESWSSGGRCRMLCMFNPRRKAGACYRLTISGAANVINLNALEHENVITGRDIFPGAVTRDKTIKRIQEWSYPIGPKETPDGSCFEVPEYLVGATTLDNNKNEFPPMPSGWRRITDSKLSYMVLGEYPQSMQNNVFDETDISRCRSNWDLYTAKYGEVPPSETECIVGADIADLGGDFNVFVRRNGGWVSRFEKFNGLHPHETAERLAEYHKEYNAKISNTDGIGLGVDVAPIARKCGARAHSVDVRVSPTKKPSGDLQAVFGNMRDQLYWELRDFLKREGSMLPPAPMLVDALRVVTYEEKDGKIKIMPKNKIRDALGGDSPDELDALLLTFAARPTPPRVRII